MVPGYSKLTVRLGAIKSAPSHVTKLLYDEVRQFLFTLAALKIVETAPR
jgi:hypothetical protein